MSVFGESAILNDGRLVVTPWMVSGCWVGDLFLPGPVLRMPDACVDSLGRPWIVAVAQSTGAVHVCRADLGQWWTTPSHAFGTRAIIRADGDHVRVAYSTSASTLIWYAVGNGGAIVPGEEHPYPNGAGGRGMRDWGPDGEPRPLAPFDQPINGHLVRSAVEAHGSTVAIALGDLPQQMVLAKGPQIGTLTLGECDWWTPRISANGEWWVGVSFAHAVRRTGSIPLAVPPLVIFPPEPPEPPVPPAKATIESFVTPITKNETSRCVMKVTVGMPFKVRWQWQNGGKWNTGAENPPTDTDHSFNRKNEPWQNVFPGNGRYPIRIQCLDKDGNVTDTSGSLRVIEVKDAVTPIPPEPPTPIPPPVPLPPGQARLGKPRGNGFQVIDDSGGYLAWGTSFFWGLGGWVRERPRCQDNLAWTFSARPDFVRTIITGLKKGDTECSLSPRDPNFQSAIAEYTDHVRSLAGRTQFTIFGATYDAPTVADRQRCVDLVCEALQNRQSSIQLIEIANEGWANGFPGDAGAKELKDLAARVATHLPGTLVATTCPKSGDDITPAQIQTYYKNSQTSIQTLHFARATTSPDGVWRPTRKPWREQHFAVDGCPLLVTNNEPRGPDSSVTQTHDPLVLAMDACTTWLCGVGSYVLHTGAGIYGIADPARGRPANMWETTGIDAICSGIRTVRSLLPVTLPNWSKHQANASDNPFTFVDVPQEQFTLAYAATSGNDIIQPVGGVVKATAFTLRTGQCHGNVFDPLTGQVIEIFEKTYHTDPSRPAVIAMATRV